MQKRVTEKSLEFPEFAGTDVAEYFTEGTARSADHVRTQQFVALLRNRSFVRADIRAFAFLSKFARRKTTNRKKGSYGLKHDAERSAGDYVANGMLIAAALAMSFSAVPTHFGSRNAHFNIGSKAA